MASYQSVAWVKTRDYWQDRPGRQSMRLNYDLVRRGLRIERIVILRGDLWPEGEPLPSPRRSVPGSTSSTTTASGSRWSASRRSSREPDLLADFGIYGDRAIGIQELDEQSRTLRFILHFDRPEPPAGPRPLGAAVALRDPLRGPPGPGPARGVGSDQRTWIGSAPPPGG